MPLPHSRPPRLNTIHDTTLARDGELIRFCWGRSVGSVGVYVTFFDEWGPIGSDKTISLIEARDFWKNLILQGWKKD